MTLNLTFLCRFYGDADLSGPSPAHQGSGKVAGAAIISTEVLQAQSIYSDLRRLFLRSTLAIDDLQNLLRQFSIGMSYRAAVQLYIRMQWEIEADNEFTTATGMDTALGTQN